MSQHVLLLPVAALLSCSARMREQEEGAANNSAIAGSSSDSLILLYENMWKQKADSAEPSVFTLARGGEPLMRILLESPVSKALVRIEKHGKDVKMVSKMYEADTTTTAGPFTYHKQKFTSKTSTVSKKEWADLVKLSSKIFYCDTAAFMSPEQVLNNLNPPAVPADPSKRIFCSKYKITLQQKQLEMCSVMDLSEFRLESNGFTYYIEMFNGQRISVIVAYAPKFGPIQVLGDDLLRKAFPYLTPGYRNYKKTE